MDVQLTPEQTAEVASIAESFGISPDVALIGVENVMAATGADVDTVIEVIEATEDADADTDESGMDL